MTDHPPNRLNNIEEKFPYDKRALQYRDRGQSGPVDIVVGLDFGTSSTKVVMQIPHLLGRPSYAVNFGDNAQVSMPYLLPTQLWFAEDASGRFSLNKCLGMKAVNDLKTRLFFPDLVLSKNDSPEQSISPEEAAAAYLALALRCCRRWFLGNKYGAIRHFSHLRWAVNLGVPSPCITQNRVQDCFEHVGKAAWLLSLHDESEIVLSQIRAILQWVDQEWVRDKDVACDFALIPEIVAAARCYARGGPWECRNGLHMVVDAGASTMDVCSFSLSNEKGDYSYQVLIPDVQMLGTIKLHQDRIRAIPEAYIQNQRSYDPLAPIPTTEEYIENIPSSEREKVRLSICDQEREFRERCRKMIQTVVNNRPAIRSRRPVA